jgi:hypothetical protein
MNVPQLKNNALAFLKASNRCLEQKQGFKAIILSCTSVV